MNMKKTLAGLMAGVVAISAMATVAVSAKAQESKTKTWTTSWTEKDKADNTTAVVMIVVNPAAGTAATQDSYKWDAGTVTDAPGGAATLNVTSVTAPATAPADANATETYTFDGTNWKDVGGNIVDASVTATGAENGDTIAFAAVLVPGQAATVNGAWASGDKITLTPNVGTTNDFKITKIVRIENRAQGSNDEITKDLGLYFKDLTPETKTIDLTGLPSNVEGAPLAIVCEVEAGAALDVDAFTATFTPATGNPTSTIKSTTNAVAEVEEKDKEVGILLNKDYRDNGSRTAEVEVINGIAYVYDLDFEINEQADDACGALVAGKFTFPKIDKDDLKSQKIVTNLRVSEPTEEMMDYLMDAKGAEVTFTFLKKDYKTDEDVDTFEQWGNRYDWDASSMKSAISLRVNNSNVLSVAMKDFDKEKFAATFAWDDVMSKFQGGSYTGLVHTLGLKIDNSKLPHNKDGVIDLELASITVKVPEMAETDDDTMVEDIVKDFAAGESATVVEDTLPAASDAPAATDAPATTDAAANPETGNSAAALLAIPAALAAAAIVAKKRG